MKRDAELAELEARVRRILPADVKEFSYAWAQAELGGSPERLEHVSNEALDACVARGLNVIQVADVARRAASDFDAQTAAAGSWSSPIVAAFAILGVLWFARRIVWP